MRSLRGIRPLLSTMFAALWLCSAPAAAAPEGTLTIALHFTPVTRWLDPAEGESVVTPFLFHYALHDALLKPIPGGGLGPSLAQSWSMSKDLLSAEFTLRANAKFHSGEPVTGDDVKFSFERYRGGAAKILKDMMKEIQVPAPDRVRFILGAVARFPSLLRHLRHKCGVDRAAQICGERRRGSFSQGANRCWPIQVRQLQPRH